MKKDKKKQMVNLSVVLLLALFAVWLFLLDQYEAGFGVYMVMVLVGLYAVRVQFRSVDE